MKEIINKIFQKNVWRRFPLCFLKRRYFKAHKIEPLDALRCFTSKLTWLTFIQMIKNRLPFSLTIKNYICKTNTHWGARQNGKSNMILFPLSRYSLTSNQSAMYNKLLTIDLDCIVYPLLMRSLSSKFVCILHLILVDTLIFLTQSL